MDTREKLAICERLRRMEMGRTNYGGVFADEMPANPDGPEAADLIQQQQATIERLSAALEKYEGPLAGSWFYPEGDRSSDACCLSPHEVLDERYFDWKGPRTGVFPIERAASLPTIYASVRVDSDDEYTATFHRTEDEASAALGKDASDDRSPGSSEGE